jgi:hypothetical protein
MNFLHKAHRLKLTTSKSPSHRTSQRITQKRTNIVELKLGLTCKSDDLTQEEQYAPQQGNGKACERARAEPVEPLSRGEVQAEGLECRRLGRVARCVGEDLGTATFELRWS